MPSIKENFHRHFWNVSTSCVVYVDKIGQLTVKELQFFIDWKIAQSKFKWRLYSERKDKQSHHNATPYQSCLTWCWCCNGVQYVWTLLMLQLVQHFPHFFVGIIRIPSAVLHFTHSLLSDGVIIPDLHIFWGSPTWIEINGNIFDAFPLLSGWSSNSSNP